MEHIPVLHDVIAPLDAEQAALAGLGQRSALEQGLPRHDFRPDEAALEVAVDRSGRPARPAGSPSMATRVRLVKSVLSRPAAERMAVTLLRPNAST